ncbi:MAG: cytochrome b/b6 domain-containing protein [Acetobacteraceae bacterium]|nr:cytochrome b/b6 domain-containing protein [Acetobacteraceae bacterium]
MRGKGLWVRVWDAPVRLFHWGVVALVFTSWLTQHEGWMRAHEIAGYTMFAALLFRFAWGVAGSDTARFRSFLASPMAAFAHLRRFARREPDREIGHNAAGGWMVLVLLALLALQVGTGLCANDQIETYGPLSERVGQDWSDWLSQIHAANFVAIEVAVLLHVAAVFAYMLLKGQNLIRPMVTGRKRLPADTRAPRMRSPLLALALLAVSGGIVAAVVLWGSGGV